jgi:hypothetical protein
MNLCGLSGPPRDLPDAGNGTCCYGAAIYGPDRCTCWEPVYDEDQAPIITRLPKVRKGACEDCAFRTGSPERRGDASVAGSEAELYRLVSTGQPFFCHQGMRRPVAWRHPAGVEIPGDPANYRPSIVNGVPYKADGAPADVCAGWATRRRLFEMDLGSGAR